MSQICVIGGGYVGIVTATCLAELGHTVTCVDIDEKRVAGINAGRAPIYEPDLDALLVKNVGRGALRASTSMDESVPGSDFVFICVGTPASSVEKLDLQYVRLAYVRLADTIGSERPIVINKSTLPPGSTDQFDDFLNSAREPLRRIPLVSNPEFLREGHAVADFFNPRRIIVGSRDPEAGRKVASLYETAKVPVFFTDPPTAELTKYASNAFLATKISFINELARLCDQIGVDVDFVARGMGMDPRIGMDFLKAGVGYGGSCLPKDIALLADFFDSHGQTASILNATIGVNATQPKHVIDRLERTLGNLDGRRVCVLGMTFKPETDDVRSSPSIEIIRLLLDRGASVHAHDPKVPACPSELGGRAVIGTDPYAAAEGCDAILIATAWVQFRELDLGRLRRSMVGDLLVDGRNLINPEDAAAAGFRYLGVGRRSGDQSADSLIPMRVGPMSGPH